MEELLVGIDRRSWEQVEFHRVREEAMMNQFMEQEYV